MVDVLLFRRAWQAGAIGQQALRSSAQTNVDPTPGPKQARAPTQAGTDQAGPQALVDKLFMSYHMLGCINECVTKMW